MDISKLTGHTPGPYWAVKVRDGSPGEMPVWSLHAHHPSRTGAGFKMGNIEGFQDATTERTAQLLASSPDLLELARMGLELANMVCGKGITDDHDWTFYRLVIQDKARTLREKAGQL